jgi:hypothetical protein
MRMILARSADESTLVVGRGTISKDTSGYTRGYQHNSQENRFYYPRGGVNIPPPHYCRLARLTDREVADPCVRVVSVFPPPSLPSSPLVTKY